MTSVTEKNSLKNLALKRLPLKRLAAIVVAGAFLWTFFSAMVMVAAVATALVGVLALWSIITLPLSFGRKKKTKEDSVQKQNKRRPASAGDAEIIDAEIIDAEIIDAEIVKAKE